MANPLLATDGGGSAFVRRFALDKTIHHGASGGPVVDTDGRLLGFAVAGAMAVYNARTLGGSNKVVHYSEVRAFIDSHACGDA